MRKCVKYAYNFYNINLNLYYVYILLQQNTLNYI